MKNLQRVEGATEYANVILSYERHRIIGCKNGIQWIIQRKRSAKAATAQWESISYCRTKKALVRLWTRLYGDMDSNRMSVLDGLPEWHDG